MTLRDGDTASFKLLGLVAFGLTAALFVLFAVVGSGSFQVTI